MGTDSPPFYPLSLTDSWQVDSSRAMAEFNVAQKVEALTVGSKLCRSKMTKEYQEWVKDGKYDQVSVRSSAKEFLSRLV